MLKIMTHKNKYVLALGMFDGLHKGHLKVLETALEMANKLGAKSGVLTFDENPAKVLGADVKTLLTNENKDKIIKTLGYGKLFKINFLKVKDLTPKEFVKSVLINDLGAVHLVCGENFRFGKNAQGNTTVLEEICKHYGIGLSVVTHVTDNDITISSTIIRNALKNGDVATANCLLGRNFGFNFKVVKGNKIGRTLGTPTINQHFPKDFIVPKYGVYASLVYVNNKVYCGVTNIGVKPSIGKYDPLSETWIQDFDLDIYGKDIRVELVDFIREEKKFENLDMLKEEIYSNAQTAKKLCQKYL